MKNLVINLLLFLAFINMAFSQQKQQKHDNSTKAYISILPNDRYSSDSISLIFRRNHWGSVPGIPEEEIHGKIGIPIKLEFAKYESFIYGNLRLGQNTYLFSNSIIQPGDSVEFRLQNDNWIINGKGKEKYIAAQEINNALLAIYKHRNDSLAYLIKNSGNDKVIFNEDSIESYVRIMKDGFQFAKQKSAVVKKILAHHKKHLSSEIYQLLKTDYLYALNYDLARSFTFYNLIAETKGGAFADSCALELRKVYDTAVIDFSNGIKENILNVSRGYFEFLIYDVKIKNKNPASCLSYINKNYTGLLKDRLLTYYLIRRSITSEDDVKLITTTRNYINTNYCLDLLDTLLQNSSPGKTAYDFSLTDSLGNIVRLSDFKGKVVVIDFFFTGCGYCKILNEKMLPVYELYKNNKNVQFVSISTDRDKNEWKNSLRSLEYTHQGSVDLYTNGEGNNSEIIKHYNIKAYPHLMIIDKSGKIITSKAPDPRSEKGKSELLKIIDNAL